MTDFKEVAPPTLPKTLPSVGQFQSGPPIAPIARLMIYSPDDWESFIEEWVSAALSASYKSVARFTGSGDKGIDVAGFVEANGLNGVWDNFQCKHYAQPLSPTVAWPEIGKILWFSFNGHYTAPRAYYFVAPRGVGTKLNLLLGHAANLKAETKKVWAKNIAESITGTQRVDLTGAFAAYVDKFDFSIFKAISPRELIEQHRKTPYFLERFGGELPARPLPEKPPEAVQGHEQRYVEHLLAAYAEHKKEAIADIAALKKWKPLSDHLNRQRESFYHAEAFRVFLREKVDPGTFESLQDEIHDGVIDTAEGTFVDGFERVKAVTQASQSVPLDAHPLGSSAFVKDRHGICHQLANDDRLRWTQP